MARAAATDAAVSLGAACKETVAQISTARLLIEQLLQTRAEMAEQLRQCAEQKRKAQALKALCEQQRADAAQTNLAMQQLQARLDQQRAQFLSR